MLEAYYPAIATQVQQQYHTAMLHFQRDQRQANDHRVSGINEQPTGIGFKLPASACLKNMAMQKHIILMDYGCTICG